MRRRTQVVTVVGATVGFVVVCPPVLGGCAHDGCANISGEYMTVWVDLDDVGLTFVGPPMTIKGTTVTPRDGCTATQKTTEGTDSCKLDVTEECADGTHETLLIECEDDGEKCGATVSSTHGGDTSTYDVRMGRL